MATNPAQRFEEASIPEKLRKWLLAARKLGILGPGPIDSHVEQAERFREAIGDPPEKVVDLGSGAGIPGLLLAWWWPGANFLLVESRTKRAFLLDEAVRELGWKGRVEVAAGRAEILAHKPSLREQFELVVARSFGPPAVVAECGAGFVACGGRLAVSEPPKADPDERWPETPLAELGIRRGLLESSIQILNKIAPTPARFPRRVGVPSKRPLYVSRET